MSRPMTTIRTAARPLVPPRLAALIEPCFASLVLAPIRLTTGAIGDPAWTALSRSAVHLARLAGRAARVLPREGDRGLQSAMWLVDFCENLVGVQGDWEAEGPSTVIRRVHRCPYAEQLRDSSTFCTLLGEILGQELLATFLPEHRVSFEIVTTLSQGSPYCEYRLSVCPAVDHAG